MKCNRYLYLKKLHYCNEFCMTELIRLYPSKKETRFQFSIAIVALYFALKVLVKLFHPLQNPRRARECQQLHGEQLLGCTFLFRGLNDRTV